MDVNRATAIVWRYCDAEADPELTPLDVEHLLADFAQTVDADGLMPSEAGWTPTYSPRGVWQAVAEGWTLKAGRCAGRYDFTTDGQQFRRSQMIDHCEAQAARYRRKANLSATSG